MAISIPMVPDASNKGIGEKKIWLHVYLTDRVHALTTHLQMSGRPMGAQSRGPDAAEMMNTSSRGQAASVPSEHSTPPRGLGAVYLTPTCGDTCRMCERRACQVTTRHDASCVLRL